MTFHRASSLRSIDLSAGDFEADADGTQQEEHPTGVVLDSDNPRAILIERVTPLWEVGLDATAGIGLGQMLLTIRMKEGSNRLVLGEAHVNLGRENTANSGAQHSLAGDTFKDLEGTLWVAPYIGVATRQNNALTTGTNNGLHVLYRVIPVPWRLHLALYSQLDGNPVDLNDEWWQP